jgi:hypothetical protein
MGLPWKSLDLKERRIILEKTKNNERRVTYLNNALTKTCAPSPSTCTRERSSRRKKERVNRNG